MPEVGLQKRIFQALPAAAMTLLPRPVLLAALLILAPALAGCAEESPAPGTPAAASGACVSKKDPSKNATEPVVALATSLGIIRVTVFCDKVPVTGQNFVDLAESGFYDGTKFHRVIRDFMNQGGDPLSKDDAQAARWGTGDSGTDIKDEFYCADGTVDAKMNNPQYPGRPVRPGGVHKACGGELGLKHDAPGVLSMANSGPDTGSSQFFVTAAATPHLDGAHPVFGRVADDESLQVVLAINQRCPCPGDRPDPPIVLETATVEWG